MAYNNLKIFCSIIFLNMLGKFIEKVISKRLQILSISSNFIYSNQLTGLKQQSTTNAGLFLIYLICTSWVKDFDTSTLVFDIAQFFLLLNHHLLPLILNKVGFDSRILSSFSNYLINRKTQYVWNSFVSLFFRADIDIGQEFAFSPILVSFYITPIFHIFEKRSKDLLLNIPVSVLSFVDVSLFISQKKSYEKSNAYLFYSYNIISNIFNQFGLTIEHSKSEVFNFSRSIRNFNPPSLDLSLLEDPIL